MLCCPTPFFRRDRHSVSTALFGRLIQKVVAMLAEIFMLRLEAQARLVEEVLPSSASPFIRFSPRNLFVLKQTDVRGEQVTSEEPPVGVAQ
jgi:hypothetical protein